MPSRLIALFAGALLASSPMLSARAADMSFRIMQVGDPARCGDRCPQAIVAQGEITNTTPDDFQSFVQSNVTPNLRSVVFIDSPGGKVVSSMLLGQTFRKLGFAAIVARPIEGSGIAAGTCFSACVYALMGARKRVIPRESRVGIHRMFSYESAADPAGGTQRNMRHDNGGMREVVARYSTMMGVSRGLIDAAEQTSSDGIQVLSQSDIARWRLGGSTLGSPDDEGGRRRRRR